jgi:hypothetical protein
MRKILLKLLLFSGVLLLPAMGLFMLPYSGKFARHFIENDCYNHGAWIFDRITDNPTPIDIAFIGSSHTIHAFQEKSIEALLPEKLNIVNLGYCRFGRNLEYLFVKELLAHKKPRLIVIEVHEDEEKNSHDIFPFLAGTTDLLYTPTLVNRDYISDLFNGASARLEQLKAQYIFHKKYPEPDQNPYGYGESDRVAADDELAKNEKAWRERLSRSQTPFLEELQLRFPLRYLDKTVSMARKKNIQIIFVYLPEFGSKLKKPLRYNYYQAVGPVLLPPDSILASRNNWMDATHFNDAGAKKISDWISCELYSVLAKNKNAQK